MTPLRMCWAVWMRISRWRRSQSIAPWTLSAVAAALSYTPSAVSQQIAALEREVGVGLVERGARGAVLTDAGKTLVRHADEILGRMAAAQEELHALLGLRAGRLRLGAFS